MHQQPGQARDYGRRVQYATHAGGGRRRDCRRDRGIGNFRAHEYELAAGQRGSERVLHVFRCYRAVRARSDRYLVFALVVDDDQGGAGRGRVEHRDVAGVDIVGLQVGARSRAGIVRADGADERDSRPRARCRDGCVRTFATAECLQTAADDGLTRCGQMRCGDNEIGIDRPDDDHAAGHALSPAPASRRIRARRPAPGRARGSPARTRPGSGRAANSRPPCPFHARVALPS